MTTGAEILDFAEPVEADNDTPNDTPPRKVRTCDVCGVELDYSGRGKPPTKCAEHKRQPSTGTRTGRRNSKAANEAAEIAARLDKTLSKAAIMVAPFDIYDASAIVAMKPPVIEQFEGVLETHDAWRAYLKDARAAGSVVGLVLAVALGVSPILAHHNMIPNKVGRFPIGDALLQLPTLMQKLNAAAEQGESFLTAYLAEQARKAEEAKQPAEPVEPT